MAPGTETAARNVPRLQNDRIKLWAHLVSEHANVIDLDYPFAELLDMHRHEHNGPGGIRNHAESLRNYSLKRLGQVLSESEE